MLFNIYEGIIDIFTIIKKNVNRCNAGLKVDYQRLADKGEGQSQRKQNKSDSP